MRSLSRLSFVLLAACLAFAGPGRAAEPAGLTAAATVTVKDGAGRTLTLPVKITRAYATSPVAIMMLYSLAPEKMVGWNYKLGAAERHYILPAVRDLPALGGWFGENGKGNRETLLASRPDVILSIGNDSRTAVDFADRLQDQVGIPVYVDTGSLSATAETYERLGALLGVPERAKPLAEYARRALADAKAFAAALRPEDRKRVYYAEGMRGLQTDTAGSMHTEALDLLGVTNVAAGQATSGFGRIPVSLDQVIAWQPEVILACPEKSNPDGSWRPEWLADPGWDRVPAVVTGRIFVVPGAPFNWLDRPPSAARLLGLKWLQWAVWPETAKFDLVEETRTFYRLFFHYDLSRAEAEQMVAGSKLAKPTPKP